jgi:hypothetical protein
VQGLVADQRPLEPHGAVAEDRPLIDGDGHVHVLLVARQLQARRADLDRGVALVPVVRADDDQVALEVALVEGAGVGQERQRPALAGGDVVAQLVVGDLLVADEVDAADLDLGPLVDLEPDVDLGLVDRLDLPLDRRQVVALLVVQLGDLSRLALTW